MVSSKALALNIFLSTLKNSAKLVHSERLQRKIKNFVEHENFLAKNFRVICGVVVKSAV